MKEKVLILGLALALVIVCVQWVKGKTTSSSSASNGDDVYTNIMTRSSVRSYQDKPVEKDKIEKETSPRRYGCSLSYEQAAVAFRCRHR